MLWYHKSTADFRLHFNGIDIGNSLVWDSDSDWANDSADRKPQGGQVFLASNRTISWQSQKRSLIAMSTPKAEFIACSSAKNISVRAEWLRQSGRAPSEPSETPRWQTTPRPAPTRRVALHIALRSQFRRFFSLCRYPIVNEHCGVVANCDHTSEWVHWVHQQNVKRSGSHTQGSTSTRHFVYHIRLCYSHKIRYLIIWHALFKYLYIYTYGQSGHRW